MNKHVQTETDGCYFASPRTSTCIVTATLVNCDKVVGAAATSTCGVTGLDCDEPVSGADDIVEMGTAVETVAFDVMVLVVAEVVVVPAAEGGMAGKGNAAVSTGRIGSSSISRSLSSRAAKRAERLSGLPDTW
jgi:hypothetical protein